MKLPDRTSYEIIIADDDSQDFSSKIFPELKFINYLRHQTKIGFLKNCNAASKQAQGEFIVFLNNDTEVLPGWLDSLLETFTRFPKTGLAGSKLLSPQGELLEAGCFVWANGSVIHYGRGEDPEHYLYNYAREVDFVSSTSIMLPRNLWEKLDGFDETFAPAYYEDVDLAFRVRVAGYQVLYQPFSQLIHFGNGNGGVNSDKGMEGFPNINRQKFFEKWQDVLSSYSLPEQMIKHALSARNAKGQILYVDDSTPKPDHYAGSVQADFFLTTLRNAGYAVTFLPLLDMRYLKHYTRDLQIKGIECVYLPYISSTEEYLFLEGYRFDMIVISRVNVAAAVMEALKTYATQAKLIFNTVDLHFIRLQRAAELTSLTQDLETARDTREMEINVMKKVDCTLVVSPVEQKLLKKVVPETTVRVVSFPAEVHERKTGFEERRDIVFLGGFQHQPNIDAILFFTKEIWPLVFRELPGVRFIIVGGGDVPKEIRSLTSHSIILRGFVKKLADVFDTCRISVAPLRFGAGIKGKILTSLGYGLPCVTTSVGVEGIGIEDGKTIIVADDPTDFANAIIRAYRSPQLWYSLSNQGQEFIRKNYSREVVTRQFLEVLNGINQTVKPQNFLFSSSSVTSDQALERTACGILVRPVPSKEEYVPFSVEPFVMDAAPVKAIAFYLPQFHPIPENDRWWGKGFTEWTNVSKAVPRFAGHNQPRLPGELGFYDLRLLDIQKRQIDLARHYGVYGFGFYYYWFHGKRLLERPLERFLSHPELDFPFCLVWANENWTRRWDGKEDKILIGQEHDIASDQAFIKDITPYLRDPRYIRIHGRPVLIIYRASLLAEPAATVQHWRERCKNEGLGNPFLIMAQTLDNMDPRPFGFDAAVQFPPNSMSLEEIEITPWVEKLHADFVGKVFSYPKLVEKMIADLNAKPYKLFHTLFPSWDNEPRRPGCGHSFVFSTPAEYARWLRHISLWTCKTKEPSERLVFINAWNEWGEGAYLEPDSKFGYAYLQATANVLREL